ncbi:UDP-N-acetyl-D-glucosamine dehydrogenase [Actinoplanes sp. NBRC 14428]|uniref:Nucleotide sugar dehydrogenase n=1 Tax=Pseudosporangium ferrugineum TaxID=439699 RepID=A0A2T0SCM2_9ACTN|nr:nucleotide sugar dehydrogenase [Pseudosporangium ferrugineum]PRY31175.1 nucleotide sugar dehydrogenase [Pseudosporangium ferrugineum]BCJ54700.1 UDP-N-acetyl-D-glucosamine dehydrogenase [Actinoplanes sp. NBRC 14428]
MSFDVVILGLGYVGLPLAQQAIRAGMSVLGFDVNPAVVAALGAGRSHVDDLSDADVAEMIAGGFRTTADETRIAEAGTAVICVPTPLSEGDGPDLRAVTGATGAVGRNLRPGMLVVLESTTYPGTTDDVVRPLLEKLSGLTAGIDFHVAFSPERIDPGNERFGAHNTPKVVGGYTPGCTDRVAQFYGRFIQTVVRTRGTREAETAKLLENTYRHVNIALVNEMARFCHELDIDLWDVIRAASTKPFGFQAFYPGPGVGGHCIPIDPNYLSHNVRSKLGYPFRFVELAQEINATMPAYVARRAQNLLNADGVAVHGAKILLLGVTYKPNIADQRESPATPLARHLTSLGAVLTFHDPYVTDWQVPRTDDLEGAAAAADLVILVQQHREYDADHLAGIAKRFFDTRGVTTSREAHRL